MHHGETVKRFLRDNNWTQQDFADYLGITRTYLTVLLNQENWSKKYIDLAEPKLGISLSNSVGKSIMGEPRDDYKQGNIVYVPLYAQGGFLTGYSNKVYIDSLERFALPGIIGEHYCFDVDGMSMYDMCAPGDRVISKPIENLDWMSKGKLYVLQTIDGLLLKLFGKFEGDHAIFESYNKEYPITKLPKKSVKRVYFVDYIMKKP